VLRVPPNYEASHAQQSVMSDFLLAAAANTTALSGNAAERDYWVSATTKRTQPETVTDTPLEFPGQLAILETSGTRINGSLAMRVCRSS
jgi:hypothetical protein